MRGERVLARVELGWVGEDLQAFRTSSAGNSTLHHFTSSSSSSKTRQRGSKICASSPELEGTDLFNPSCDCYGYFGDCGKTPSGPDYSQFASCQEAF